MGLDNMGPLNDDGVEEGDLGMAADDDIKGALSPWPT